MLAPAVIVAMLSLLPLLFVIASVAGLGWRGSLVLIARPRVGELLINTAALVIGAGILSAIIGTGAAWLVERTSLPGTRWWRAALTAPLAVPAFVNSFAWSSLTPSVEGYWGALIIVTLSYYPLIYLPVSASLRRLDPALEDTAHALGHGPIRAFARVVLPQLKPALLGGALLVGLHLLAEFGALQMLRYPTLTTAIFDQYRSSFNGPAATALAGVLVLCCLLMLLAELRVRGSARNARIGSGASSRPQRCELGRLTVLGLSAAAALVLLAVGVPIGSLLHWTMIGSSTGSGLGSLAQATITSLVLAIGAAVLTTLLALPVAALSVRSPGRWSMVLERSTYFGSALPGIVVALALVTVSIRYLPPAYQTVGLLLAGYAIMFLPRANVALRAALGQEPAVLRQVAASLGLNAAARLRRVTLPLIRLGVGTAGSLVFLAVLTELTATLLLAPIGVRTLATEFWSSSSSIAYGQAAPYALTMVALSLPATLLLTRSGRRNPA